MFSAPGARSRRCAPGKVFKVSRSGYYYWLKRKPSARQIDNQEVLRLIREIHCESKGRYGSPKITAPRGP